MMTQERQTDNGPEFTSYLFEEWAKKRGIELQYFQPGTPIQNGLIVLYFGLWLTLNINIHFCSKNLIWS